MAAVAPVNAATTAYLRKFQRLGDAAEGSVAEGGGGGGGGAEFAMEQRNR